MEAITDEHIASLVQAGDTDAFGILIERYETKLKRYARKFLNTNHEIDDLVQDVFIKSYINIQSFDTNRRFSPWIYRIAHNTFVNGLKYKLHSSFDIFDADTILPFIAAQETADSDTLDKELSEEMGNLINQLSIKDREIIVLHYFESLSYQEINDILKIPITTVGVRLTRARAKLKKLYQINETDHE